MNIERYAKWKTERISGLVKIYPFPESIPFFGDFAYILPRIERGRYAVAINPSYSGLIYLTEGRFNLKDAKAYCQKHLDELVASIICEDSDNERILTEMAERPAVKMERKLRERLGRKPTDGELLDELRRQLDR